MPALIRTLLWQTETFPGTTHISSMRVGKNIYSLCIDKKTHTKGTNSRVIPRQTRLATSHNLFTLQSLQECAFPSPISFFLQLPTPALLPSKEVSKSFLKICMSLLSCFFY